MNTTNQAKLAQCPHCKSVFDVSEEEMQLALGAVRCGECMKIFNASYNLIDAPQNLPEKLEEKTEEEIVEVVEELEFSEAEESYLAEPDESKHASIPTLHDHPKTKSPKLDFETLDDDDDQPVDEKEQDEFLYIDSLLSAEQEAKPTKTKKITPPIIAGLFVFLVSILVAGWLFINKTPPTYFEFTEVRLSPSSNPKQMDVHFKLTNITQQSLPLPSLNIQLLNLSSQPISSEQINAANLYSHITQLDAASSRAMTVSVKRPTTFVQSARIQVHLDDTKL